MRMTRFAVLRDNVDIVGRKIGTRTRLELTNCPSVQLLPRRLTWLYLWDGRVFAPTTNFLLGDENVRSPTTKVDANTVTGS